MRLQVPPHRGGRPAGPVGPVEVGLQRIAQVRFLADLAQPAPDRVDVDGAGLNQVLAKPADPGPATGSRTRIAHAVPERLVDPVSRHVDELIQVPAQRCVHLRHENQAGWNGPALQVVGLLDQEELGEVQPAHETELERGVRQPLRRARGKPFAEIGYLLRRDHRPDRHANLMWHGSAPRPGPNMITARSPGSTAGTRSGPRAAPGGVAGNGAARCQSWTSSPATPCRSAYRPAA